MQAASTDYGVNYVTSGEEGSDASRSSSRFPCRYALLGEDQFLTVGLPQRLVIHQLPHEVVEISVAGLADGNSILGDIRSASALGLDVVNSTTPRYSSAMSDVQSAGPRTDDAHV